MRKLANEELERLNIDQFKATDKTPLIVILDNVRSLNNVGSVFRTCDAFLVKQLYLCGITATPPNKEIHKTALGATESVDWIHTEHTLDVVKQLQSEGIKVWAVEQAEQSVMLDRLQITGGTHAVIFGNEVKGVSQEVVSACDGVIEIPQYGTKHSLNVSVSAGIVVWDMWKKLR
ncbi:MAG: RNA methyltransferase [Capnocytophaga sp.]|nr:RNA methyltransferase [Capnocytophaga sp.]